MRSAAAAAKRRGRWREAALLDAPRLKSLIPESVLPGASEVHGCPRCAPDGDHEDLARGSSLAVLADDHDACLANNNRGANNRNTLRSAAMAVSTMTHAGTAEVVGSRSSNRISVLHDHNVSESNNNRYLSCLAAASCAPATARWGGSAGCCSGPAAYVDPSVETGACRNAAMADAGTSDGVAEVLPRTFGATPCSADIANATADVHVLASAIQIGVEFQVPPMVVVVVLDRCASATLPEPDDSRLHDGPAPAVDPSCLANISSLGRRGVGLSERCQT